MQIEASDISKQSWEANYSTGLLARHKGHSGHRNPLLAQLEAYESGTR